MCGKISVEILRRVQSKISEVEARRDGASHQNPTPDGSSGLHNASGHNCLRDLARKKRPAEGETSVPRMATVVPGGLSSAPNNALNNVFSGRRPLAPLFASARALAEKMELEYRAIRACIVVPLLVGLNDVPRTHLIFGQEKVDRRACRSNSVTRAHLLWRAIDLAVVATFGMRLEAELFDHSRCVQRIVPPNRAPTSWRSFDYS
jgi:hypothetical protein